MKKTILKSLTMIVGSLCVAGTAMALPAGPWDTLGGDYVASTEMNYWTPTDLTTNSSGNSLFQLQVESASYESDFGLFTKNDDGSLGTQFKIYDSVEEPFSSKTVTFSDSATGFFVTTSYSDDNDDTNDGWQLFDNVFGFFYHVENTDNTFFTDKQFNTAETGVEHIVTAYSSSNKDLYIYLDDQVGVADRDFNDMTVFANDLQPVPEPSTMLLFGAGLAGLLGYGRKRNSKKS